MHLTNLAGSDRYSVKELTDVRAFRTPLHDPLAALEHVEAVLWPNGPVCPHCGATDRLYALKGKSTKPGVRKCGHCLKLFTVTVGTVFESSHVPLNKWLQAPSPAVLVQEGHQQPPAPPHA
jgi:transposase-like protein